MHSTIIQEIDGLPVQHAHHYLTVDETAALLRVTRDSVYRLIHQGKLPAVRIGRMMRVDRRDLDCLKAG